KQMKMLFNEASSAVELQLYFFPSVFQREITLENPYMLHFPFLNKQQLQVLKERFQAFLNGETQIVADEAFCNAVRSYYEVFLKSDRVARMVHSGGCSASDFRDVFKKNIEKRVRSLPEIDGLSKETVLSSWLAKYDAIYRGEEDLKLFFLSPPFFF
uniref:Calcium dependent secretion activator 2 n=1 Tax=Cyanistes caeruleus TaxID=156563 RepID=A0A8C0ZF02_CYACU